MPPQVCHAEHVALLRPLSVGRSFQRQEPDREEVVPGIPGTGATCRSGESVCAKDAHCFPDPGALCQRDRPKEQAGDWPVAEAETRTRPAVPDRVLSTKRLCPPYSAGTRR